MYLCVYRQLKMNQLFKKVYVKSIKNRYIFKIINYFETQTLKSEKKHVFMNK